MENPYQLDFMQRLRDLLPEHLSLADQISEILNISQDSAYRRIRGETAVSVDEAITLCNHYKIPIAVFTDEIKGLVNFKYVAPDGTRASFIKHIDMIYRSSDALLNNEDRRMIYAAIDAPLFQHFAFEPLARFKMHFWMREIEGISDFKSYYDPMDVDKELVDLSKKIYDVYLELPSDEIWPDDILHTTLRQIMYYWEADYFAKVEDALAILDTLQQLVMHAEEMAANSCKLIPGDRSKQKYAEFNLFQTDVLLGNNTVLTTSGGKLTSYITHMTFSILATNSNRYAHETENWLKRILAKSNLISGIAEKNRKRYFKSLLKQLEVTRERITSGA